MHRQVREHLEEMLTEPGSGFKSHRTQHIASGASQETIGKHLAECHECTDELRAMREQAALLRQLRPPALNGTQAGVEEDLSPRPGFYARVMERIEAEGAGSIWSLFFDSAFGHRLTVAALALAVLLAVCLVTTERFSRADAEMANQPGQVMPALRGQVIFGEDQPGVVLTGSADQDSVLVNLVTYQEQ